MLDELRLWVESAPSGIVRDARTTDVDSGVLVLLESRIEGAAVSGKASAATVQDAFRYAEFLLCEDTLLRHLEAKGPQRVLWTKEQRDRLLACLARFEVAGRFEHVDSMSEKESFLMYNNSTDPTFNKELNNLGFVINHSIRGTILGVTERFWRIDLRAEDVVNDELTR